MQIQVRLLARPPAWSGARAETVKNDAWLHLRLFTSPDAWR
jgi:hypothetical protein